MNRSELPSVLMNVVESLWAVGAVRVDLERGFELAFHENYPEAPRSPWYLNLRVNENKQGPLRQDEVGRIALAIDVLARMNGINGNWICGIPNAGVPFGQAMSRIRTTQHLDLRKFVQDGHRGFAFANGQRPHEGDRVLLIDDLISDATVKRLALRLMQETGAKVALLVFLDREQGGLQALRAEGYDVFAAMTLTQFLDESEFTGRLKPHERAAIADYPRVLAAYKAKHGIT